MPRSPSLPEAPEQDPPLSLGDRVWSRVLPTFLRPGYALHVLIGCRLDDYEPLPEREDIQLDWIRTPRDIQGPHRQFLDQNTSAVTRRRWFWHLGRGEAWLGLAWWQGAIRHFMLVQVGAGGAYERFAPLMHPGSVFIGPALTTSDARGQGIYPYVLSRTLAEVRQTGTRIAYGSYHYRNEASRRGIEKDPYWRNVARVLLRRRPFGLHWKPRAATILDPDLAS